MQYLVSLFLIIGIETCSTIEYNATYEKETKKKLDAGAYKVEAIPDMAEVSGKRFDYMRDRPKNK